MLIGYTLSSKLTFCGWEAAFCGWGEIEPCGSLVSRFGRKKGVYIILIDLSQNTDCRVLTSSLISSPVTQIVI